MKIRCPKCQTVQDAANFCNNCGIKFEPITPNVAANKSNLWTAVIILVLIFGVCAICGIISNSNNTPAPEISNKVSTPVPSPTLPPTFGQLKTQAADLLKFERAEYTKDDLIKFDAVMIPLAAVPKDSKDYNEAQKLHKQLIDKVSVIAAEVILLGDKPTEFELKYAFNDYLSDRLNDYDSSEYLSYTPATKEYVKKEPFWTSVLRLRAKNAFGAYIVRDVKFYIRNKKVVLANGL